MVQRQKDVVEVDVLQRLSIEYELGFDGEFVFRVVQLLESQVRIARPMLLDQRRHDIYAGVCDVVFFETGKQLRYPGQIAARNVYERSNFVFRNYAHDRRPCARGALYGRAGARQRDVGVSVRPCGRRVYVLKGALSADIKVYPRAEVVYPLGRSHVCGKCVLISGKARHHFFV